VPSSTTPAAAAEARPGKNITMSPDTVPDDPTALRLLLIETHSPWESGDVQDFLDLTRALLDADAVVQLHLMQNGVIWLRGEAVGALAQLRDQFGPAFDITVDDLSLDLRGLSRTSADGVGRVMAVDDLVATMVDPAVKTIWHS
jgi:hypothetical protein